MHRRVLFLLAMGLLLTSSSARGAEAQEAARTRGLLAALADPSEGAVRAALERVRDEDARQPEVRQRLLTLFREGRMEGLRQTERGRVHYCDLLASAQLPEEARTQATRLGQLAKDPDAGVRRAALKALKAMGVEARSQAPLLVNLLKTDPEYRVREAVVDTLGALGEAARPQLPALAGLLKDPDWQTRELAVRTLGALGPVARAQAPLLVPLLKQQDTPVSGASVAALGRVASSTPSVAPRIGRLLKSPKVGDQQAAARALGAMGSAGSSQAPQLIRLLRKEGLSGAGWDAVQALGRMPEALPTLLPFLDDPSPQLRGEAVEAMGALGAAASAHAPRVALLLVDGEVSVRRAAATALGRMGAAAAEQAPQVSRLLENRLGQVREAATRALGEMGPAAVALAPRFGQLLKDPDGPTRVAAAEALGKLGPAAADQAPLLAESLKDPNSRLVLEAVRALGKLGPAAAEHLPPLVDVLKRPLDEKLEPAVLQVLQGMPAAAPLLGALLGDPNPTTRRNAALALAGLGAAAREQAPLLGPLLGDGQTVSAALQALRAMGEPAREQAPKVAALLEDKRFATYNTHVARTLGALGAREYAPRFVAWLGCSPDWHWFEQREVEEALRTLAPLEPPAVALLLSKLLAEPPGCREDVLAFAHLVGGGDAGMERLLAWVARPAAQQPAHLTLDEARETLRAFAALWPLTETHPALRRDVAERIAGVAQLARGQWGEADRALLDAHERNLREAYPRQADAVASAARGG